jgi:hypothetical protein
VAGRCRELCGIEIQKKCNDKGVIRKSPEGIVAHIKEKKKSCWYHEVLYDFLEHVYGDCEHNRQWFLK